MIHHSTFCTMLSTDSVKFRNGSALAPTFSAAMPTTREMTTICSTLKSSETLSSRNEDSRPRKLAGTTPERKSSQLPELPGAPACSDPMEVFWPGLVIRPNVMPIETAIRAVMANQSRVWPASRAALVTLRRFAIETTIAVNTSGGTTARSRETKVEPIVSRVTVSQFSVFSATLPILSATNPRAMPSTRPRMICVLKEGKRSLRLDVLVSVDTVELSDVGRRPRTAVGDAAHPARSRHALLGPFASVHIVDTRRRAPHAPANCGRSSAVELGHQTAYVCDEDIGHAVHVQRPEGHPQRGVHWRDAAVRRLEHLGGTTEHIARGAGVAPQRPSPLGSEDVHIGVVAYLTGEALGVHIGPAGRLGDTRQDHDP